MTSAKRKLHSFFRYFHAKSVCRTLKRSTHVFMKNRGITLPRPVSNQGLLDSQSSALPTELSRLRNWMTSADRKLRSFFRFFHAKSDCTALKVETRCSWKADFLCCRDPGSNQGALDLQSNALPNELSLLPSWMTSAKRKLHSFFRYFHAKSVCRTLKRSTHVFMKNRGITLPRPVSNQGLLDSQSSALPTELSRLRNWMTSADRKLRSFFR